MAKEGILEGLEGDRERAKGSEGGQWGLERGS